MAGAIQSVVRKRIHVPNGVGLWVRFGEHSPRGWRLFRSSHLARAASEKSVDRLLRFCFLGRIGSGRGLKPRRPAGDVAVAPAPRVVEEDA